MKNKTALFISLSLSLNSCDYFLEKMFTQPNSPYQCEQNNQLKTPPYQNSFNTFGYITAENQLPGYEHDLYFHHNKNNNLDIIVINSEGEKTILKNNIPQKNQQHQTHPTNDNNKLNRCKYDLGGYGQRLYTYDLDGDGDKDDILINTDGEILLVENDSI